MGGVLLSTDWSTDTAMTDHTPLLDEILEARTKMNLARVSSDRAAAEYRQTVRRVVETWRSNGVPLRRCAERMSITEGALRELLRAEGVSRRTRKKKAKPHIETVVQDQGGEVE